MFPVDLVFEIVNLDTSYQMRRDEKKNIIIYKYLREILFRVVPMGSIFLLVKLWLSEHCYSFIDGESSKYDCRLSCGVRLFLGIGFRPK